MIYSVWTDIFREGSEAGKLGKKIQEPTKQELSGSSVHPTERDTSLSEDASFPWQKNTEIC